MSDLKGEEQEESREAKKKRNSGVFSFISTREGFYQVQVWSIFSSYFPIILFFMCFSVCLTFIHCLEMLAQLISHSLELHLRL